MNRAAPLALITLGPERSYEIFMKLIGEKFCYTRKFCKPDGVTITEGFIELPAGCSWAKSTHGGCKFCAFQNAVDSYVDGSAVSASEFIHLFDLGHTLIYDCQELNIFTGGSFWDGLPQKSRRHIAARVYKNPNVKQLNVESRPEYITHQNINEVRHGLKHKKLRVAIGLETQDNELRNYVLNKGISRKKFECAVSVLKETGCSVAVYVLVKPHKNVSEAQAIDEASATIRYAKSAGVDEILLQGMMVMPGSLSQEWHEQGEFRPPWLWSIVKILQDTHSLMPVRLGKFDDSPSPIAAPSNCRRCNPEIHPKLDLYRKTLDIGFLKNLPNCSCLKEWLEQIS